MFNVFAVDVNKGLHYLGVINGPLAEVANEWFQDNPNLDNSLTLKDVPFMVFPNSSELIEVTWVIGEVHLDKVITEEWKWNSNKKRMPPIQVIHRDFSISVPDRPKYKASGFTSEGQPILHLQYCTGTPPNIALLTANITRVITMQAIGQKKQKVDPKYASEACHEAPHDHPDKHDDDSPPPSPVPGPSRALGSN